MMLYENLHYDVLEFDVHDGCHRLLLRTEQSWPKHHTQVGDGHQVLLMVTRHTVQRPQSQEVMGTFWQAK